LGQILETETGIERTRRRSGLDDDTMRVGPEGEEGSKSIAEMIQTSELIDPWLAHGSKPGSRLHAFLQEERIKNQSLNIQDRKLLRDNVLETRHSGERRSPAARLT
jgi:hypothetical protein